MTDSNAAPNLRALRRRTRLAARPWWVPTAAFAALELVTIAMQAANADFRIILSMWLVLGPAVLVCSKLWFRRAELRFGEAQPEIGLVSIFSVTLLLALLLPLLGALFNVRVLVWGGAASALAVGLAWSARAAGVPGYLALAGGLGVATVFGAAAESWVVVNTAVVLALVGHAMLTRRLAAQDPG